MAYELRIIGIEGFGMWEDDEYGDRESSRQFSRLVKYWSDDMEVTSDGLLVDWKTTDS